MLCGIANSLRGTKVRSNTGCPSTVNDLRTLAPTINALRTCLVEDPLPLETVKELLAAGGTKAGHCFSNRSRTLWWFTREIEASSRRSTGSLVA